MTDTLTNTRNICPLGLVWITFVQSHCWRSLSAVVWCCGHKWHSQRCPCLPFWVAERHGWAGRLRRGGPCQEVGYIPFQGCQPHLLIGPKIQKLRLPSLSGSVPREVKSRERENSSQLHIWRNLLSQQQKTKFQSQQNKEVVKIPSNSS